jgi:hypothetical protein
VARDPLDKELCPQGGRALLTAVLNITDQFTFYEVNRFLNGRKKGRS